MAQQAALEPPYRYNRVVVENDLSVTPPRQVCVCVRARMPELCCRDCTGLNQPVNLLLLHL